MATGSATSTENVRLLAVRALEVGDWANALGLTLSDPGETAEAAAYLSVLIRIVSGGQALQATGDVAAAERLYAQATELLPAQLVRTDRNDRCFAVMLTGQLVASEPDPALCAVANVIAREQAAQEKLRRQLLRYSSPRDFLIEAAIQFQGEVEGSPFCWLGAEQPAIDVTPTRKDLLRRASNLRKWARPRLGDVSESVWKDIGAHRGLWAAAMGRLADRPMAPEPDVPPRRGHQEAAERARRWKKNLTY